MTKRQLIDEITMRNPTAKRDFLVGFKEADLGAYLDHLIVARRPRLSGGSDRYAKYFVSADRMSSQAGQAAGSGPVRGLLEDRLTAAPPTPAPVSPVREAAQADELPLEPGEPAKTIQPALFAPQLANVDERAQNQPIPIPESTWREESELSSSDADILSASGVSSLEGSQERQPQDQQQDAPVPAAIHEDETSSINAGEAPATQPESPAGSYQGEVAPIVVFQGAGSQEQTPDALEEISGLPSPYGQEFHGEGAAMNDHEDAPSAEVGEIEHEEIATVEPIEADDLAEADDSTEEDIPVEETVEDPAEESVQVEESVQAQEPARKKAKPARKKREPVAVGAERETNNNQDSDSWLF